ncbi:MAG: endo alpha-1,4 polygalactosaminidase [Hyphomicrobiaceae bacterium]
MSWLKRSMVLASAVLLAGVGWWQWQIRSPSQVLSAVKSWDYQLQKIDPARLERSMADLLVIDYSRTGRGDGAFSRDDVMRLKLRPDGSPRLVVAYLSVGEAEEYRYYWKAEWKSAPPPWLYTENCRWPGNHLVRYWMDDWKELIFRGQDSYLAQIIAAGFDGVYLDRIDAYWDLRETYPQGQAAMVDFVAELAEHARRAKPGFLVIAQNAEALLDNASYRAAIDALAKEDLLHGVKGTGVRNDEKLIAWSLGQIDRLKRDGKPVLVVEYLQSREAIAQARKETRALGLRSTFPTRALDGRDPLDPPTITEPSQAVIGTPEFHKKHCT